MGRDTDYSRARFLVRKIIRKLQMTVDRHTQDQLVKLAEETLNDARDTHQEIHK